MTKSLISWGKRLIGVLKKADNSLTVIGYHGRSEEKTSLAGSAEDEKTGRGVRGSCSLRKKRVLGVGSRLRGGVEKGKRCLSWGRRGGSRANGVSVERRKRGGRRLKGQKKRGGSRKKTLSFEEEGGIQGIDTKSQEMGKEPSVESKGMLKLKGVDSV